MTIFESHEVLSLMPVLPQGQYYRMRSRHPLAARLLQLDAFRSTRMYHSAVATGSELCGPLIFFCSAPAYKFRGRSVLLLWTSRLE
jgi:hypothetical protein